MKRFEIVLEATGPLLVGGHSAPRHGGDRGSARDAAGRPLVPASALRGALRMELERLLRGRDGDAAVCSPNRDRSDGEREPCECPVCRLFGVEGYGVGTLRLEDARLDGGREIVNLRPQVAVGRRSGSAVSGHLAFAETIEPTDTEPLRFVAVGHLARRGPEDDAAALEQDLGHLRAACAALTALGGGKARGIGWVDCRLEASEAADPSRTNPAPARETATASSLRLRFEPQAPLHFGLDRPRGGFHPTRTAAPGSTVRGALAWALLDQGHCSAEDPRFVDLFGIGEPGASFGSARATADRPSLVRRRCRRGGHVFDDLLVELVRREAARCGVGLAPRPAAACPVPGCEAVKAAPWPWHPGAARPRRRVRTRTALNRRTGTSMDRKLYSLEVLDPQAEGPAGDTVPLVLEAVVEDLSPEGAELLATLDGGEVWLGGRRSRGLGRCRLRILREPEHATAAAVAAARKRIEELTSELRAAWSAAGAAAGADLPSPLGPDERLVAIVLREPWRPEEEEEGVDLHQGPLAAVAEPVQAFVGLAEQGRFGAVEAARHGASSDVGQGELPPVTVVTPGSVFVYRAPANRLDSNLAEWLDLGRRGSGFNRAFGWGRFEIRGPGEIERSEGSEEGVAE